MKKIIICILLVFGLVGCEYVDKGDDIIEINNQLHRETTMTPLNKTLEKNMENNSAQL